MSEDVLSRPAPPVDARFTYGANPSQFADLRVPRGPGPHPVVLCIHGGFWRVRYDLVHLGHLCAALTARGYATWNIEYRRLGEDGGGWPGTFDDVRVAAEKLRKIANEHALDLSRLILLGHSAGGHLALWLAKTLRPLQGVVPLAPVADLARAAELALSNGVAHEILRGTTVAQASPRHMLPLGVPSVVVHGEDDDVVPLEIGRTFVQEARKAGDGAELVALPGTGHFELIDPGTKAFSSVLEAIGRLGRSPGTHRNGL